jgi:hypothetical protein
VDFAGLAAIFPCSIEFLSKLRCCCNFWEAVLGSWYEDIIETNLLTQRTRHSNRVTSNCAVPCLYPPPLAPTKPTLLRALLRGCKQIKRLWGIK